MQLLGDQTVIAHTYQATVATGLFDEVVIATDSAIIRDEIQQQGGKVIMTHSDHESGTDRIAEAVKDLAVDVIVNVQGDTPFVNGPALQKLLTWLSPFSSIASRPSPLPTQAVVSRRPSP